MSLAEAAKPALPSSTIRSYAMIGIVLYTFGLVLNEIGNGLAQKWLVPYADTISALGFVIALYTATLAGPRTPLTVVIGLIYGLGFFSLSEPPTPYLHPRFPITTPTHHLPPPLLPLTHTPL